MTILAFIVVIGILVFVHELGHFLVAKWCGVRCEVFSLGFGPAIFKKQIGETLYQVAAIPLGGYVKMTGEDPSEEMAEERGETEKSDLPPVGPERMFSHQPVGKRLAIVFAGPLMNFILAVILVPLVYMMGIEVDTSMYDKPTVGYVEEDGSAAKAGILTGDLILKVDGKDMKTWKGLRTHVLFHPDSELSIELERNGEILTKKVQATTLSSIGGGTIGIHPPWPSEIKRIIPGKPAEKSGLKAGDKIVRIDQMTNPHWFQTHAYIQQRPKQAIEFEVLRGEQSFTLQVTPEPYEQAPTTGFIGIEPVQPMAFKRFPFFESIKLGLTENIEDAVTTFAVVGKLLSGRLTIKTMGGPVQIAELTGMAAEEGLTTLMRFMAFISMQLGVLNLLPIPVLDGGHVLFMLIEKIKGSPLNIKARMMAQQVGMLLLLGLMVVVTVNDLLRHKESFLGFIKNFSP